MKIRTKIALQFTVIIAVILAFFAVSFYYLAQKNRKEEFYKRLHDQAIERANLLIKVQRVNQKKLLKLIGKETLTKLYSEKILMFNDKNKLVYQSYEADTVYYNKQLFELVRKKKYVETVNGDLDVVGTMFTSDNQQKEFVLLASAEDYLGKIQLQKLRDSLITSFLIGIFVTIGMGWIFAGQSLKPIAEMNQEVSSITAYNLRKPLNEGNKQDEIAKLAMNFNQMFQRLEQSFDLQRSFVSNASHELRTPLAAIKSEIQVTLEKERTADEYQKILHLLLNDTQRLIQLTNGLLQLAQSEKKEKSIILQPVRLDELVFQTQEELQNQHTKYQISIDFDEIPDNEQFITVMGSEALLKTVISNLMDNACKYSTNKRAEVRIGFDDINCLIRVTDNGIGIPANEINRIFEPLYRAKNATTFKGYGIGLSVCRRIMDMHQGTIKLKSELGKGSVFEVLLPHL
jgi:two-component system, OmpR family, sensor histidine kinase ArlS